MKSSWEVSQIKMAELLLSISECPRKLYCKDKSNNSSVR
jgi:hypothetical protein